MTGEKNKFKTHEQLWKLEDGELSTPKHDELVLQLLYKENAKKILYLCFPYYFDWVDSYSEIEDSRIQIRSEVPVCSKSDFIIGYVDVVILYNKCDCPHPLILYVEVKPSIPSFGTTLRQLQTYTKYLGKNFVLYSPDVAFKGAFDTQGISIITPSDLELK